MQPDIAMHRLSSLALASVFAVQVLATSCPVLPDGFLYKGCYNDTVTNRALSTQVNAGDTVESCVEACDDLGFTIAGLEFGNECYCDSELHNDSELSQDGGCDMPCAGNPAEICGGPDRLSVYSDDILFPSS